jgi:hypothetical protein
MTRMGRESQILNATGCDQLRVFRGLFWLLLIAFALGHSSRAQNGRLETGAGLPLQTVSLNVSIPPLNVAPLLSFDFAFATAEQPAPGVLLDALSFSLQTLDQTKLALLLTVDASGLVLVPATPGALPVNLAALKAASIAYFGSLSDPAQRSAFHVTFAPPGDLANADAQLLMDLFDNADGQKSVGTVANLAVVIAPEPGVIAIGILGAFLLFRRRFR